jgi:hypothetical protein
MPFETFKRQRVPQSQDPTLTLQKRGAMSLNRAAFEAIGEPAAVELLWDREERLIGLRKTEPDAPYAYAVRPGSSKQTSAYELSGAAFTKYYGIDTEVTRRYICRLDGDILVADLKEPGLVLVGNRTRSQTSAQEASWGEDQPPGQPESVGDQDETDRAGGE